MAVLRPHSCSRQLENRLKQTVAIARRLVKLTRELRLCEQPSPWEPSACARLRHAAGFPAHSPRLRLEHPFIVSYFGHEFVMGAQGGYGLGVTASGCTSASRTKSRFKAKGMQVDRSNVETEAPRSCTSSLSTAVAEASLRTAILLLPSKGTNPGLRTSVPVGRWQAVVCQAAPYLRARQ